MPKSKTRQATAVLDTLDALYPEHPLDVQNREPLRILIATMLSARTKDPVTNAAMQRLWARAATPQALLALPAETIAELIKPVGFYQQKARQVQGLCRLLLDEFAGRIPATREELMRLPGVGRKTANLVLNICFDLPAICVDTHVHRISNRLGWVTTATPEETEQALMALVPQKYWALLNRVLVNHGQRVCDPLSPKCSSCPIATQCARKGVGRSR
jgi:endonuclease III